MNDPVKQVIVMRLEYPDPKKEGAVRRLRLGKMIAQGSHSSMSFLAHKFREKNFELNAAERAWLLDGSFAKICVYVNTEEELMKLYDQAKAANLEVNLITDSGRTEFNGVPTRTCIAIGPDFASRIDPITGKLPLL